MVRCGLSSLCYSKNLSRRSSCCRSLGCHLFNGEKFLCGADHFTRKMLVNTWDLRNVAVVCRLRSRVGVVRRCELYKKYVILLHFFITECIFHQKEPKANMTIFLCWVSLFPYYDSKEQVHFYTLKCLNTGETGCPTRKRAKASRPPCIHDLCECRIKISIVNAAVVVSIFGRLRFVGIPP